MNPGRPLRPWRRLMLRPIGWRTFAVAFVPWMFFLWQAMDPQFHYMGIAYMASGLALIAAGLVQLVRGLPKRALEERLGQQSDDFRRWCWYWGMSAAALLLIVFKVPLWLGFLASQPAFERTVAELRANPAAPLTGRHLGLYTVMHHTDYGTPDAPLFLIHTHREGGGFRYSPRGPERLG